MSEPKGAAATIEASATALRRAAEGGGPTVGLVIYHRLGAELVALVPGADVVVGRAAPATVVISDVSLSRVHARFSLVAGEVVVEDLGSTNGTVVAGQRIERATVQAGEEVALGAVTVTVHHRAASSSGALLGHDRFRAALDEEIARARFFGRPVALLVARAFGGDDAHVRLWSPKLQGLLRPVDKIGIYSDDLLEILLPETNLAQAAEAARMLSGAIGAPHLLRFGVGAFPETGTSAEKLLGEVRAAAPDGATSPLVTLVSTASRTLSPGSDRASPTSQSEAMRRVLQVAARVARGMIPVLVLGETGCGKEVIARYLHDQSPRRGEPLVCVNCAAISAPLLESALFGHEKGAFTGATSQQKGVFEAADGGTVFLDEIGELPAAAQAALLRVLETKRFSRVGSTKEIAVDVRVVAATHRDLDALCDAGDFRQDLLYRLNTVTLKIPPLRDRIEDIAPLCAHFLALANEANGTAVRGFDPDALEVLCAHGWPGNVRELRNAIDRAVVIALGESITSDDLPDRLHAKAQGGRPATAPRAGSADPSTLVDLAELDGDFRTKLERLEAALLALSLREAGYNQSEAARRLGMPLRTLTYKLKLHGIRRPPASAEPPARE